MGDLRAHSVTHIMNMRYKLAPFEGAWFDAFEQPEFGGIWFIYGQPTNGKTSFCILLLKELAKIGLKSALFSFEEGVSKTLQNSFKRFNVDDEEIKSNIVVVELAPFEKVVKWLKTKRLQIVMIDSIQKWKIRPTQLDLLLKEFPKITFIIISHVKSDKLPDGATAIQAYRDAKLKIWVEGHRATSKGRFIGPKGYFTIWQDEEDKYLAKNL